MSRHRHRVSCDIAHPKRLHRVAKVCEGFGSRLQYSVFECPLDKMRLAHPKAALAAEINHDEDQVLFVSLGPAANDARLIIEAMGQVEKSWRRVTVPSWLGGAIFRSPKGWAGPPAGPSLIIAARDARPTLPPRTTHSRRQAPAKRNGLGSPFHQEGRPHRPLSGFMNRPRTRATGLIPGFNRPRVRPMDRAPGHTRTTMGRGPGASR